MNSSRRNHKKTAVGIRPLADRAVLRPLEESAEMKGGLFIPDTAKEKPQQGEVIAVGPGGMEKGVRVPMELQVGQKVLFAKYSGSEVTIDDQKLLIIKESDVLAVLS